jgi:hypothetical protein
MNKRVLYRIKEETTKDNRGKDVEGYKDQSRKGYS